MTELVGILNITPDSFSDGGQNNSLEAAIKHAEEMFSQGASMVDVGAESTRPGAKAIDWKEEVRRLTGFIQEVEAFGWNISLDTYRPETVDWVSKNLSNFIINDVTGFRNPAMRDVAASTGNKVIVGHLPKTSHSISDAHREKPIDSINQVIQELRDSIEQLVQAGVVRDKIIVDPGIGFGKTKKLNWKLLRFGLYIPEHEVMIGYSRKRFLGENRMEIETNYLAGRIAVDSNAKYLRVHDVSGHASLV